MCGLFAIFLNRPLTEADIAVGRTGTDALRHRGPDGSGEWIDREGGVYMGHRRLAIIDPDERSAQPMVRNGRVLAYNGEIYNFRHLAKELVSQGVHLDTTGDVEVLLRAWERWGAATLDKMDGMFAFALWDGSSAHIAVDPFGEKPLFYATTDDGIYVSSELAPLADALNLSPTMDAAQWCAFLSYGNLHAPDTPYPSVRRLPPASTATIVSGRIGALRCYWTPPFGEPGRGAIEPVPESGLDRIAEVLAESISGRLIADVPLALFLSGGVDSSLIAAITAQDLKQNLTCLSVSFPRGDAVDEAPRAAAIARHLNLPHRILENREDPEAASATQLVDILQQPHDNLSALSVYQLSRTAAAEFKVCLTGMGGDEITFGYGKHDHVYRRRQLYDSPECLRILGERLLRPLNEGSGRLANVRNAYLVRDRERYIALKDFPAIDGLRRLPGFDDWTNSEFDGLAKPSWLSIPRYELVHALPNDQLIVYDHASMRASLELRTPFLNRKLVEVIAQFDPRALLAFGQKSVLRRLLRRYLPNELFDYPKSGFRFPHDVFLNGVGDTLPSLPGLQRDGAGRLWSKRFQGKGWTRIGVRLASATEFFSRHDKSAGAA
jgi:asparagine synthase (glutamine-hydrolysing)